MQRQDFLKKTLLTSSVLFSRPFITFSKQKKFRTALIGTGWWGLNILREAIKTGECEVVALCDVDQNKLNNAFSEVSKLCKDNPKKFTDFRELLKKEQIDIVINATPDHWHALIAIASMEAGANLFLEKPIGHTINEGKAMLKTLEATQKVCIVDFHRRYSSHNITANQFIKAGNLGKITEIKAFVNYNYGNGEASISKPKPENLDWDFWCGPAPLVEYHSDIHPRGFRQYMNFANGQLGDWGPHWFDQILWNIEETAPKSIYSTSKIPNKRISNWDAPETQTVIYQFEEFSCTWQHSILSNHPEDKHQVGVYFVGTKGTLHLGWRDGWTFYPSDSNKSIITQKAVLNEPDLQNIDALFNDFLNAIKTKKQPQTSLKAGHLATNMALLGVIAQKEGKSILWDKSNEIFLENEKANQYLSRQYRNPWQYPSF